MAQMFIGTEAFAAGAVSKYDLRARYRRVLPNVYTAKRAHLSVHDRAVAAWLWSRREGVISGVAASALHGAKWVDDDAVDDCWATAFGSVAFTSAPFGGATFTFAFAGFDVATFALEAFAPATFALATAGFFGVAFVRLVLAAAMSVQCRPAGGGGQPT